MKTTIIECAKNQSVSTNEKSRWTCSLKEGKVVKTGDLISVEGISINSIGIGGDIIEIPEQINNDVGTLNNSLDRPLTSLFPNEKYSPSAQSLVCGLYLHHNYKDTCGMPFSNYKSPAQIQGCVIDNNPSIVALHSNAGYGYILGDAGNLVSESFEKITEYPTFAGDTTNLGTRFYAIGAYVSNDNGGEQLDTGSMDAPSIYNPANFIEWRMVSTELRFEVDKGYDSPENIATSINKQINMGWVSSASFQNELTTNFVGNNDGIEGQLLSNKGSIYTIPVNSNYLAGGNYFYQLPFFLYPEFVSAGYNLISPITEKVPVFNKDGLGSQSSQGEILNMNELPNNGVNLDFPQGTILVSNLKFNADNCDRVRKYLWSQGGFNGGYKIDENVLLNPTNETMSEAYYKEHPEIFFRYIDMGRLNDMTPTAVPAGSPFFPATNYLTPYTLFHPIEPVFTPNRDAVNSQLKMKISYTDERWETAITPPDMVGGGVGMELKYEILEEYLNIAGEIVLAREMAKRYNINVVCVKCSSTDVPNPEPVIAFVLDAVAPVEMKPLLSYSNFVLYDPAFYRRSNSSIKPIGWRKKIDTPAPILDDTSILHYETTLQLGSPNPTFSFDESLGRFQLSNLYWGHYIGSGESDVGVVSAPEQVISLNKKGLRFGSADNQYRIVGALLPPADYALPCLTLIYADSGLGILYFAMKIDGLVNKWDYIKNTYDVNLTKDVNSDNYANTIVEPEKYFKNSLLYRLGWNYADLFPTFGMARNLFLNNTYNKVPKLLLYNPIPTPSSVNFYKSIFNIGVRPLTINPYFTNGISTGLSINNYGQPMFDIHLQRAGGCSIAPVVNPNPPDPGPPPVPQPPIIINSINITATTDYITATRLPQKLEYPYWLVYSDIIGNVEYLGKGGENNNILAIANRAYTSGDFAFNFATDYTFKATKDFVLTDITTEILNPDYSSSTIADGTIVLYKIQSPILQFNQPVNHRAIRT